MAMSDKKKLSAGRWHIRSSEARVETWAGPPSKSFDWSRIGCSMMRRCGKCLCDGRGRRRDHCGSRLATATVPSARQLPSVFRNSDLIIRDGGQHARQHLQIRRPGRDRFLLRFGVNLRCQRWNSRCHLRSSPGCIRQSRQRRNTFLDPMAPKGHHIRCSDKAAKHQHNYRQQRLANGQLDAQSPTQT